MRHGSSTALSWASPSCMLTSYAFHDPPHRPQNQPQQQQASNNEDFLDKAVDQGLDRAGYSQDRNTVEKISDGLRTGL